MSFIDQIILRMKEATNTKSDIDLANYLGLSNSNAISSWRSRKSKPYAYCDTIAQAENVRLDWLISGTAPKFNYKHPEFELEDFTLLDVIFSLSEENKRELKSRIEAMQSENKLKQKVIEIEKKLNDLANESK